MNLDKRWAQLMTGRIVVVDCETTGLYPADGDRIVSVAMVCIDDGVITHTWTTLINPDRDSGAVHIHGITTEMLADAPRFAAVAGTLHQTITAARALGAHNASFDLGFLGAELARVGLTLPPMPTLDTRTLTRTLDVPTRTEQLADVATAYGIPLGAPHCADQDATTTAKLLVAQLRRGVHTHNWDNLTAVSELSHPWKPAQRQTPPRPRQTASRGLSFQINLDLSDDHLKQLRAEREQLTATRAAGRTPGQETVWDHYAAATAYGAGAKAIEKTGPALLAEAASVWPDGHPDRIEIADRWLSECSSRFDGTRTPATHAKAAQRLLNAFEVTWTQHHAAGTCREQVRTYGWQEAVALIPTKPALTFYRRWAPELDQWPPCGRCAHCRGRSRPYSPGASITWYLTPQDGAPAPSQDVQDVQEADLVAAAWMDAFTGADDLEGVSAIAEVRLKTLERAGLTEQAASAGQAAIDAGAISYSLANRLGITYERKLANPGAALAVSELALTWPPSEGSTRDYDAIVKRAQRAAKKL